MAYVTPGYLIDALMAKAYQSYTITRIKESNMYKNVDLTNQTAANRKAAEEELKRSAKGRKAKAMVETVTYGDEPFASLTLENDHGGRADDSYNPRYMSVRLGADDLEALQNAIYAARVEIHKHTTKLKNPTLTATAW